MALAVSIAPDLRADVPPFELPPDQFLIAPTTHVTIFKEPGDLPVTEEILRGEFDANFQPLSGSRTSLGVTGSAWWLRFEAVNPTDDPITWVMNFPTPTLDTLDLYEVVDGRTLRLTELGDKRPVSARPLAGAGFAVPIITAGREATTIYVGGFRMGGLHAFKRSSAEPAPAVRIYPASDRIFDALFNLRRSETFVSPKFQASSLSGHTSRSRFPAPG